MPSDPPRFIAIASGKGGVGKTWLAITLSHALVRAGRRVLLFDADLGLANIDVQLGLMPALDLSAVISGRTSLAGAVTRHEPSGLDVLAGPSGSGALSGLPAASLDSLLTRLREHTADYDAVVLDLSAGIDRAVRRIAAWSDLLLVVATDEPTSLTDAYAVLKLQTQDRPDGDMRIVINQARSPAVGQQTYATLRRACAAFLKREPPLAGVVRHDLKVRDAIRHQQALLVRHPGSRRQRTWRRSWERCSRIGRTRCRRCNAPGRSLLWPFAGKNPVQNWRTRMLTSKDRILLTHVGSLPRNETLSDLLIRREAGEAIDTAALDREIESATVTIIREQVRAGVDIGNDGEQSRIAFQTYVPRCMCGFGGESHRPPARDQLDFPSYVRQTAARFPHTARLINAPAALSEIRYVNSTPIKDDAARLNRLGGDFQERFITAPSPGIVATTMINQFYDTHEAYLMALASALAHEYRAIHEAGLVVQIDSPDLAMERHRFFSHLSEAEFLVQLELHVAAINKAIESIPPDRVRLHVCWGNSDSPHTYDIAMAKILPALYRANVGALSIEFSNPRHQHEYDALRANPLPKDMLLIPGVIDTTTNFVEHPELVARRLAEAVSVAGDRERVIAGTDCGFGTFTGREYVAHEVVWAKLAAAAEGARIASNRLWGRSAA